MTDDQIAHYDQLANRFNQNWAYNPQFVAWMSTNITGRLNPQPGERALDLGCGTGLYSQCLARRTDVVVCADPSKGMLQQLPTDRAILPVCATAQDIIDGSVTLPFERYDMILAKEIMHHIPPTVRPRVLRGIAEMLAPGGRMLLILMPPTINYPLFEAALRRYEQNPINPAHITTILASSGLRTTLISKSFPLELSKDRWLAMVRDRYMSLLTKFDDQELEAGITEIDVRFPESIIRFNDRYIFVQARNEGAEQQADGEVATSPTRAVLRNQNRSYTTPVDAASSACIQSTRRP